MTNRGRSPIFPTRILCPECGDPMKLLRSSPRKYSCPNPDCNVIEVRLQKEKSVRILRRAMVASNG